MEGQYGNKDIMLVLPQHLLQGPYYMCHETTTVQWYALYLILEFFKAQTQFNGFTL